MVVLAAGSFSPGVLRAREERQLSCGLVDARRGARVKVHCQGLGGALADVGAELGYVKFGPDGTPQHQTLIKRDQCRALSRYLRSDKQHPTLRRGAGRPRPQHESMHMAGITSESAAECGAVQRDARLAELLGASPADALALAESYWTTQYPHMPGRLPLGGVPSRTAGSTSTYPTRRGSVERRLDSPVCAVTSDSWAYSPRWTGRRTEAAQARPDPCSSPESRSPCCWSRCCSRSDPPARRSASPRAPLPLPRGPHPLPTEGIFEGRPYRLFTPDRPPTRLVVALHPLYGNPAGFQTLTRLDRLRAPLGMGGPLPGGSARLVERGSVLRLRTAVRVSTTSATSSG